MKKVNIYQIDAFTDKPFCGNPAAVVKSDKLTDQDMQYIAKEMNLSETAFIISSGSADYKLRWFTPLTEVELCGHATIASLHFLKEAAKNDENFSVNFETRSGILKCYIENNYYYMQIPKFKMNSYDENTGEIISSLGLTEENTGKNFILLDNGYLYIYAKTLDVLKKINPDFSRLKKLSETAHITDFVVYTLETVETDSTAHLRFFSPYWGIDEDPVTGSAIGPLISVLSKTGKINFDKNTEYFFEQGDVIGRPGRVKVIVKNDDIYIAGKAITVLKGEIVI